MEKKYIIQCRYESFGINGKEFIPWFNWRNTPVTESEGNELIKETQKNFGYIDQKTKLKHEYRLKSYEEFIKEQEELENRLKIANEKREAYLKSDEYKELQKKKRQSAKERKERQKKFLEEHKKEEM